MNAIDEVAGLLAQRGGDRYGGEAVTQLEHALQCAALAEAAGAAPALVAAALLHDFGHLIHDLGEDAAERGVDDRHEYRALASLAALFPDAVLEPIRLHVQAKRYLCAVSPGYREALSPASKVSLELQGGVFSAEQAAAFAALPFARDAARLRAWDDAAKVPGRPTPPLSHFLPLLERARR